LGGKSSALRPDAVAAASFPPGSPEQSFVAAKLRPMLAQAQGGISVQSRTAGIGGTEIVLPRRFFQAAIESAW